MKRSKTFDVKKYRVKYYKENSEAIKWKSKLRYQKNKEEINEKRRGGTEASRTRGKQRTQALAKIKDVPCAECGNRFPSCCMDFDHVRGKKSFTVGMSSNRSWKSVLKEIAKCDIVCANCHRIRTTQRRQA